MSKRFAVSSIIVLSFAALAPSCAPELHVGGETSSSSSGGTAGAGGGDAMSSSTSSSSSSGVSSSSSSSGASSSSSTSSGNPPGKLGDACTNAAECASTFCEDGVCCNQACNLPCTKCNQTGSLGSCFPLPIGADDCPVDGELCNGTAQCVCGVAKVPTMASCPAPWENGPTGGSCLMRCNELEECRALTIKCPEGFECIIECSGTGSCRDATINCPPDYRCSIQCTGDDGCRMSTINCDQTGPCGVQCGTLSGACDSTKIECNDNACVAACAGTSKPILNANGSCGATGC